MRQLVGVSLVGLALLLAPAAALAQPVAQSSTANESETRPATTTTSGTTGIWFVPSASVLPNRQWSASLYRTNMDDGQGFSDISSFPLTFAYGLGGRAELFGSLHTVTRIDRDTRPLFFESTDAEANTGTGGGIVVNYPLVNKEWTGSKFGDAWVGGKINLLPNAPAALALRGMLKIPVGNDASGVSSGKMDGQIDVILSHFNPAVELAGFGGMIFRGSPDGYQLTNGIRWGIGAALPQRYNFGFRVHAELFGEKYLDNVITAPAGLVGSDGSFVPVRTSLRSPAVASLGVTWQAPNGFFVGAAASWNVAMKSRGEADALCTPGLICTPAPPASFDNTPKDDKGLQIRIGWHPGARRQNAGSSTSMAGPGPAPVGPATPAAPPAATAPPAAPQAAPAPAAPANRPPTVNAACDPCEVEVGRTSTITADAQDPDGDPLTYQWKTASGTVAAPTTRQSLWTAPGQPGPVPVAVTVNDGRGGTASDSVTIQVVQPRAFVFEDVHFEFDRFNIRPDALQVLSDAVTAMQANANLRLTIEGHTCNIGTAEYNLALGERRATAVRSYLVSRGVSADRLQSVSYGEERPKHDNDREETRRLNRRAALTVRLQ
jgi:outer membrane protein OmpA-like peptidoglycan-associated protein